MENDLLMTDLLPVNGGTWTGHFTMDATIIPEPVDIQPDGIVCSSFELTVSKMPLD